MKCGGEHLKRDCPKLKENNAAKDKVGETGDGKIKGKDGQMHAMFKSISKSTMVVDFSELGEGDE